MKSVDESNARERFFELLDDAQRQPVVIQRLGEDLAALVSMADYERLRVANVRSLLDARRAIATEAAANGLTEGRLTDLLSDDETS
jgi:prevent-host-death family protein